MNGQFSSVDEKFHRQSENQIDHTHIVFAIKDEAAQGFGAPLIATNKPVFFRSLKELFATDNPASKYPADHSLWELGRFDYRTGRLTPHNIPTLLGSLQEFKDALNKE